jgi:voltage-gated potassium channel Kch
MILMGAEGYTKKTGFLAGLTVAQISEFSLILVALGVKVGHLSNEILSFVTLIGLITIAGSTYMIIYSNKVYHLISKRLSIFERKNIKEKRRVARDIDAILFGYNRIGFGILRSLKKIKRKSLVVDFNPDVIYDLKRLRIPCLYGDIDDEDLLDDLPLQDVEIAISTVPEFETNSLVIENVRRVNRKAIIIVRAHSIKDALGLYKEGADYVLTPHFLGGEYVASMLKDIKTDKEGYKKERDDHIKMLTERLGKGQEHPEVEKS